MNPLPFWMGRGGRRGFSLGVHGQPGWRSGTDSMSLILLIPIFPFTMMTARSLSNSTSSTLRFRTSDALPLLS